MRHLTYILLIALTLLGCRRNAAEIPADEFAQILYQPTCSENFAVYGNDRDSASLLVVNDPWQGASGVKCSALILNGAETPTQVGEDMTILSEPAKRIVAMSSTYIAMLDALEATDLVVGVSGIDFISNEKIQARRDEIADVGNEQNVDFEKLVVLRPDLVLLYGINARSAMEPKLRQLGIPFLYIGDYVEQSPLGKAEWIVAIGHLIGRRAEAERYFADVKARYEAMNDMAKHYDSRPKVMINMPYNDVWYMPSTHNYVARLIEDAGGEYIYRENTTDSSMPIDIEQAYLLAAQADVWINPGRVGTLEQFKAMLPRFAKLPVVAEGRVYNNDARLTAGGGSDFYESGAVNPDLVLRDLVTVFHPQLATDSLTYYRRLE